MYKIYVIWNDFDGKEYVGQTRQPLKKRFQQHKSNKKTRISHSINYHGAEHFFIREIDSADTQKEADKKEKEWIKRKNTMVNGYNIQPGGIEEYRDEYQPLRQVKTEIIGNRIHYRF